MISFVLGMMAGAFIGTLVLGLCKMAKDPFQEG
jgi:hypothetical protein